MEVDKSGSGDYVAVDRDGVVRGSVVDRVDSELITRIASALRCTLGQLKPDGSEEWDADSRASAMMFNNKEGMYNIRHSTDQYIQIGDSELIPEEAIGDINLVFHQLDEHGNLEDVEACVQGVIYTPWLGFNFISIWKVGQKIYCSVNPTGTQAGKLRFIRRSANDSFYATRLPPPTPVDVASESALVSSTCNPPMPVGVSRESAFVSACLLYTSPSPRDKRQSRMPSSA